MQLSVFELKKQFDTKGISKNVRNLKSISGLNLRLAQVYFSLINQYRSEVLSKHVLILRQC
jgi:stage III sporulation protein SpoIIIAA